MKIAIVGAGFSGLTLAHRLKGLAELKVFEKSRGFGGRMATRHYQNFSFDHGAQFFKAKTPSFQNFLKPMIEKGLIQTWKGSFVEFEKNKRTAQRLWSEDPPHYVGVPGMNVMGKYLAESLETSLENKAPIDKHGTDKALTKDFVTNEIATNRSRTKKTALEKLGKIILQ